MRISSMQQFNRGVQGILNNQEIVNKSQQQISSGRKILTPADDPIASTRILQLQQDIALREQYAGNLIAAKNHQNHEEVTLEGVIENLQKIRTLTINAGNGATTKDDRGFIAAEIDERLNSIVDLLNTRDASNVYVFSGFKGEVKPFVERAGGGFSFEGDQGQRSLQVSANATVAVNDSGEGLFVNIPSVNNTFFTQDNPNNEGTGVINVGFMRDQADFDAAYPEDYYIEFNADSALTPPRDNYSVRRTSDNRAVDGLDVIPFSSGDDITFAGLSVKVSGKPEPGDTFLVNSSEKQSLTDTVQMLIEGLRSFEDNTSGSAQIKTLVSTTLTNIDSTVTSISTTRSEIGARLNSVESIDNFQQDLNLVSQQALSTLQDLDFAEAVSRLSLESFLLEASQQTYTRISGLSLFNHI
ncbi:MAG: flagellar hook-associated protein FlgL [Bermanella sp.]